MENRHIPQIEAVVGADLAAYRGLLLRDLIFCGERIRSSLKERKSTKI